MASPDATQPAPEISVVICTCNPAPSILSWALDSIEHQTVARDRFEVLIIDNASSSPVAAFDAVRNRRYRLRVVEEQHSGVNYARCTGIREASAPLIVFADDDNYLDPDYLSLALEIASREPGIGAFGGIARLLCDRKLQRWQVPLMIYFGIRDYGSQVITSNENKWGEWEPIGAGMVFRRNVGEAYVNMVRDNALARRIGRSKTSFICGEDSLLARLSYGLGYSCSYQPALKLTHFIRGARLTPKIVAKTIAGVGRSHVLYETVLGTSHFQRIPAPRMLLELCLRGRHRVRMRGLKAGLLEWFWDIGYYRQIRECVQ